MANEEPRPRVYADCADHQGPCPWVACRHNIFLDVNPRTGKISFRYPNVELEDLGETCSLRLAALGSRGVSEVSKILNVAQPIVSMTFAAALAKLRPRLDEPTPKQSTSRHRAPSSR